MRRLIPAIAIPLLVGCAALITKSGPDEPELFPVGVTEAQLTSRLGQPVRSEGLAPPKQALSLWESDHGVSLLLAKEMAVSRSVFHFQGRFDKDARASQAGFDSFMTLGIAEIYLIPKALWQRATKEELRLNVWFGPDGRAVAFKWEAPPTP